MGATGLVGRHVVAALLASDQYRLVRTLVRRPTGLQDPRLEEQVVDLEQLDAQRAAFQVDDVFCCLGTTIKTAGSRRAFAHVDHDLVVESGALARDAGAERLLVVSALNATVRSPFFYSRVKGRMELSLRRQQWPLLAFFQPSLLRGQRDHARAGEDLSNRIARLLDPWVRWSRADWLPVDAEQVARAMVGMALYGPQSGLYRLRYRDFQLYADKLTATT